MQIESGETVIRLNMREREYLAITLREWKDNHFSSYCNRCDFMSLLLSEIE